jgi:hypothetical protein
MLERGHYELLAKYDSTEKIDFDADELAIICSLLNLNFSTFSKSRFPEHRARIIRAIHEQNKALTELGAEYLNRSNQGSEIEAYKYLVRNIGKIRSPFLLDFLGWPRWPQAR